MGVNALTIEGTTSNPEELLRRLGTAMGRVSTPSAVVVYVTGQLTTQLDAIAEGIGSRFPGISAVVAATEGLFTERGELDAKDGYGCLLHSGKPAVVTTYESPFDPFECLDPGQTRVDGVSASITAALFPVPTGPALHLFSSFPPGMGQSGRLACRESHWGWFGAVTTTDAPLWVVTHHREVVSSQVARLEFPSLKAPLIVSGTCCRVVSEPMTVTAVSGTTLLELDQVPALVALGKVTSRLAERAWIVLALMPDANAPAEFAGDTTTAMLPLQLNESGIEPVFRPLRGIDPARGALVLKDPIERGARVAFAVRDDRTAKRALEEALRRTKQRLSGTSPRFGLYFEGVGRGRQLYGAPNIELSLVRQSLGQFPLLGSRSALELRERGRSVVVQSMSGELALFTNPS